MDNRWEDRGVVWPVLLILAGVVLLLNNTGELERGLLELLFRMWPAILLAAGIELLIPKRSAWTYLLTLALVLGVFGGSYLLLDTIEARAERGGTFSEPLAEGEQAILVLHPIIGELQLTAGAPGQMLVAGTLPDGDPDRVSIQRSQRGGRTVVEFSREFSEGNWFIFPFFQERWNLRANSGIPLEVEVDLAVGLMNLDLAELELSRVDAGMGVGEIRLRLPDSVGDASAGGGVGLLRIEVPADADVRIRVSRGLAALDLPDDYRYADGIATSPGARAGSPTLELEVNLGVGLISIVEFAP